MFTSDVLADHWAQLDEFEGEGDRRAPVSARLRDGNVVEAQVYVVS